MTIVRVEVAEQTAPYPRGETTSQEELLPMSLVGRNILSDHKQ